MLNSFNSQFWPKSPAGLLDNDISLRKCCDNVNIIFLLFYNFLCTFYEHKTCLLGSYFMYFYVVIMNWINILFFPLQFWKIFLVKCLMQILSITMLKMLITRHQWSLVRWHPACPRVLRSALRWCVFMWVIWISLCAEAGQVFIIVMMPLITSLWIIMTGSA